MLGLRMPELLLILLVVIVLFGAKKLPELGDSLGKGIRAFRKASEKGFQGDDGEAAAKESAARQLPEGTTPPSAASPAAAAKVEKKA